METFIFIYFNFKTSLQLLQVFSENLQKRRLSISMKLWSCDQLLIFCFFNTYKIKCFMCHVCWKKEGGHTLLLLESLLLQTQSKHFIHEICVKIYKNDKKNWRNSRITFVKNKYIRKTDFVLNILLDFKDIFHSQIWNVFKNSPLRTTLNKKRRNMNIIVYSWEENTVMLILQDASCPHVGFN